MPNTNDDNLLENIPPAQWDTLEKLISTNEFNFDADLFHERQTTILDASWESPSTATSSLKEADSPESCNVRLEDLLSTNTNTGNQWISVMEELVIPNLIEDQKSSYSSPPMENSMVPENESYGEVHFNFEPESRLQIIAEPKASYRERYGSEVSREKNRAQRFIRTEDGNKSHEYPTIKIPKVWLNNWKSLYVRVSLVTVVTKHVQNFCVHPYPIDTSEKDVIRDREQNSLYFRVTNDEMQTGEKSFRITRKKMVQTELRNYGKLRLFDLNEFDNSCLNSQDPKKMIEFYELWKSQLVFTLAVLEDQQHYPTPIISTAAISQITIDVASEGRKSSMKSIDLTPETKIRCVPQRVLWEGDEPVVLIFPNPIKQRIYEISMEFDSNFPPIIISDYNLVDRKTMIFQSPPCPFLMNEENFPATLIIKEDQTTLGRIPFEYLSLTRNRTCSNCFSDEIFRNKGKKRFFACEPMSMYSSNDGGENLVEQMSRLNIEQVK